MNSVPAASREGFSLSSRWVSKWGHIFPEAIEMGAKSASGKPVSVSVQTRWRETLRIPAQKSISPASSSSWFLPGPKEAEWKASPFPGRGWIPAFVCVTCQSVTVHHLASAHKQCCSNKSNPIKSIDHPAYYTLVLVSSVMSPARGQHEQVTSRHVTSRLSLAPALRCELQQVEELQTRNICYHCLQIYDENYKLSRATGFEAKLLLSLSVCLSRTSLFSVKWKVETPVHVSLNICQSLHESNIKVSPHLQHPPRVVNHTLKFLALPQRLPGAISWQKSDVNTQPTCTEYISLLITVAIHSALFT